MSDHHHRESDMSELDSKTGRNYETADTIRFQVSKFSRRDSSKKTHSDKHRDSRDPNVYPRGNGTPGYLALYIDVANGSQLPFGWSYPRDISFTVINATDPKRNLFRQTSHVFTADEPDWGYNQIAPLATLAERDFLPDDTLTVIGTFKPSGAAQQAPPPLTQSVSMVATARPVPVLAQPPVDIPPPSSQPPAPVAAPAPVPAAAAGAEEPTTPRDQAILKLAGFEKLGGDSVRGEFVDAGAFKWRLVASRPDNERVSAFVEAVPVDASPKPDWSVRAACTIKIVHPRNRTASAIFRFVRNFKEGKNSKGYPCLAFAPALESEGFIEGDTLTIAGTFMPMPKDSKEDSTVVPTDLKVHTASTQELRVDGFSAQEPCRIYGRWAPLNSFGHWRIIAFPRGQPGMTDHVSVAVEVRPSAEVVKPGWHLRAVVVACIADPSSGVVTADAAAVRQVAIVEFVDNKLLHVFPKLVSVKDMLSKSKQFLADDAATFIASLRTDPAVGMFSARNEKRVTETVERLTMLLKNISKRTSELGTQATSATVIAARDSDSAKQLSASFVEENRAMQSLMAASAELGAKIAKVAEETAKLREEQETLSGSCTADDLPRVEDVLTKTLQKLLMYQGSRRESPKAGALKEEVAKTTVNLPAIPVRAGKKRPSAAAAAAESAEGLQAICESLLEDARTISGWCSEVLEAVEEIVRVKELLEHDLTAMQSRVDSKKDDVEKLQGDEASAAGALAEVRRGVAVLRGDDEAIEALQPKQVAEYIDVVSKAHKTVVGKQAIQKFLMEQKVANLCMVCLDRDKSVRSEPCGHTTMCTVCAAKTAKCPLCKNEVKNK